MPVYATSVAYCGATRELKAAEAVSPTSRSIDLALLATVSAVLFAVISFDSV